MTNLLFYARAVHFAATLTVAGVSIFVVFVAEPAFRKVENEKHLAVTLRRRLAWIAWLSLALFLLSGASWLVLTAASMSGQPLPEVYTQDVLWTVLSQTDFGTDWLVRFVVACVLAALFVTVLSARGTKSILLKAATVICAAALAGSLAWAGHANGGQGIEGVVHPAADVLHLIAAAAWVGGLVPLAMLLSMTGGDADQLAVARIATVRFSTAGIAIVATLLLTGMVNSWYLVGSISALTESEYGRLLLIKLALFLAMVGIAAFNWSQLTPRLIQNANAVASQQARRALRRNAAIEASLGALIICIVAVLGTLPPASHAHMAKMGMADILIEPGHVGRVNATIHLLNDY